MVEQWRPIKQKFDEMYERFIEHIEQRGVEIPDSGILAGPVCPVRPMIEAGQIRWRDMGWDNAHFPLDYRLLMQKGIPGIIACASEPHQDLTPTQQMYRALIADCWIRIREYVRQHGEAALSRAAERPAEADRLKRMAFNCLELTSHAPETFEQGLQLFWFIWRLRSNFTSCIGRMDVHLQSLYERDVPQRISREEALALLCELWEKLNAVYAGDTLMNLMLGGVDAEGKDVSSDLSVLIMEATMRVARPEPHINVRIHANSRTDFLDAAARLIAMGQGQGVLYYDENIIPNLVARGVPLEYARQYANDGCTEITFDGLSGIWFWQMESVKSLELALFRGQENPSTPFNPYTKWAHFQKPSVYRTRLTLGHDSGDFARMTSFDEVYAAFLDQYGYQINRYMDVLAREVLKNAAEDVFHTSPIVAGLNEITLDTGVDPMRGGWAVENYQLLSGSIPTLADALYAIREGVFERGLCTMKELIHALSVDFEGFEDLRLALKKLPKFGNDVDAVDQLAADLAAFFCDRVENYPTPLGVKPLPGIYNIDFNTFAGSVGATPDGRKGGDLICEHYSPTPGNAKNGPTAVIQSAAKADLKRGCASSPLYLVLPRGLGAVDAKLIRQMMKGCGEAGLPVVSISIYDKSALEDALLHPDKHEDLVVRVWGFNARFIDLDEGLKRHVMSRIL